MFYFKIAIKSILERRRQYKSLFAVCIVGVCLMLCALMITDGMIISMNEKARQYYGGDLQFLGGEQINNTESFASSAVEKIKQFIDDDICIYKRFNHDAINDSLYFEGASVRQRVILGVDFENEKSLFEKFTFIEGSFLNNEYKDTILISLPIATKLGCHVGDSITLYTKTSDNYTNTIEVVVSGIFQDSSVFGMYTSYMSYDSLMKVLDYNPKKIDRISFYYLNGSPTKFDEIKLQKQLEQYFTMYPLGMNKEDFYEDFAHIDYEKWALISLESNISQLKLLVQALRLIVAAIVILLVIIISVGISSTYRVIVIKRSVESGTMRALGMKPIGVMKMFVAEAFLLLICGSLIGFCFSVVITKVASSFDLSFISGFDLFLTGGHLMPCFNLVKVLIYISIIVVTTLLSVLFTLRKLVRVSPVGAITATT